MSQFCAQCMSVLSNLERSHQVSPDPVEIKVLIFHHLRKNRDGLQEQHTTLSFLSICLTVT